MTSWCVEEEGGCWGGSKYYVLLASMDNWWGRNEGREYRNGSDDSGMDGFYSFRRDTLCCELNLGLNTATVAPPMTASVEKGMSR